jgi:hypothetical protein
MFFSIITRRPRLAFVQNTEWDEFLHRYYEPVADPGGGILEAKVGVPVTLNGSGSSDSDGEITKWCWDLDSWTDVAPTTCENGVDDWDKDCEDEDNDDCQLQGKTVQHTFTEPSPPNPTITLTVWDDHNQQTQYGGHAEHFETDQEYVVYVVSEAPAVHFASLTATGYRGHIEIAWTTASEISNTGFNLYRDGEKIAFVESQGASDAPRTYTWIDKDVTMGVTYTYKISDVALDGTETMYNSEATATPKAGRDLPRTYALYQNSPNPFNPTTEIRYALPEKAYVSLKIYNPMGQEVITLVDGEKEAGWHTVSWSGTDNRNRQVASGIYFYRLQTDDFSATKKMVFLK